MRSCVDTTCASMSTQPASNWVAAWSSSRATASACVRAGEYGRALTIAS